MAPPRQRIKPGIRSGAIPSRVSLLPLFYLGLVTASICAGQPGLNTTLHNHVLTISVGTRGATFSVEAKGLRQPVFTARVGAEVDHHWIYSTDYLHRQVTESATHDALGAGKTIEVILSGLPNRADLAYTLTLYDDLPFGTIQVQLRNPGTSAFTVQDIRVLDVMGNPPLVNLDGREGDERVLSDSYSEDRPPLKIFDLGRARKYEGEDSYTDTLTNVHFAVGSQLIYNRASHDSLFLGALTADKWLTVYYLNTQNNSPGNVQVASYAVDCTGTTEVMKKESLRDDPPGEQIELNLPLDARKALKSEEIMFAAGRHYHAQLESYGKAVRQTRHALVSKSAPWGWWSWTAYYFGLSQATALTNAEWLVQHLRSYGFNYFHIDEGYAYADGEYTTPNATLFPDGIRHLGYKTSEMGLTFGIWVAPFRVSKRSWVYQKHPEWLVHEGNGNPIQIGYVEGSHDALFVLDTTNPGAQEYLRETFHTLVREWDVRYIKLDFMDDTGIEGYHYLPHTTAIEAEQIGLKIIRDAVGPNVLLDKDGSPMLPAVGYCGLGRISTDTGHSFRGAREDATGIAARYYMNGSFYRADPDAFSVSKQLITDQSWHQSKAPLTLDQAEVSITLAAIAGGMFEIGDDLPTLGADPERLGLVKNSDLLDMVRLGRAAIPVDLMNYRPQDAQPSVFFLKEDARQSMLAVFNWTDGTRSHVLPLRTLGYAVTEDVRGLDVFRPERKVQISEGALTIRDQAPQSVRLIKLVNLSVPVKAPSVEVHFPSNVEIGHTVEFRALTNAVGTPATHYRWNFGDGTSEDGPVTHHGYTRDGQYRVKLILDGLDGKPALYMGDIRVVGKIDTRYDIRAYRRYGERDNRGAQ
jgi:alpha-galactosidase